MRFLGVIVWLCAAALPLRAFADAPVIVFDDRVAQYRQAAASAKKALPDAVEVNPASPDFASTVGGASVVVAVGQQALSAAQHAAPDKPIVYCLVLGIAVASTSTVTGVPMEADPRVVLTHIKALSPSVRKVGLLYNAATGEAFAKRASEAAAQANVALVPIAVPGADAVKTALTAKAGSVDAIWLPPDPKLFTREIFTWMLGFTAERKLPLYGFLDSYTEAGALASVSPDYDDIGYRAGKLAEEIAGRGAGQRVPVPSPVYSPGRLTINLQTAHALGIEISQNAVAQARQVYR